MSEKYPKPYVSAAPLDVRHEGYTYASVFGFSIVRERGRDTWLVRTPGGDTVARSAHWRTAMAYALALRVD